MITVKHIDRHGAERVFAAIRVEYQAHKLGYEPPCEDGFSRSTGRAVFVFSPPYDSEYVYDGSVYIMNEAGKTVAKYDLGGWARPVPQMPDPITFTTATGAETQVLNHAAR